MQRRVLKIIGILLILCSAFFVANKQIVEIEESVRSASALRSIMEQIKNMIECYSLPIGQILKKVELSTFKDCGYESEKAPCDLLEFLEKSSVSDTESFEIFFAFAKDFGKEYRQDELLRCSMFLERIRNREQKLLKESAKKKKVVLTVSLCAALAVVILFI